MEVDRSDEPGLAIRSRGRERARARDRSWLLEGAITSARPLVRPAPRSAMFFPLVVLVAVLPGLLALGNWDLSPPGPWWGLRAFAVLEGSWLDQSAASARVEPLAEAWAFRTVTSQPPLYAWLAALGFALSPDRDPLASVLPSYVAGAFVVVLAYWHGRLWCGPGLGLVAAVLTGFNRNLLLQMQQATPNTLALAGLLGTLLCYGWHLRVTSESSSSSPWEWGGPIFWAVMGGLALGLSLMAVGLFGLVAVPLVLLHQAYLNASAPGGERERPAHSLRSWPARVGGPSVWAGAVALALALCVAAPWHLAMARAHGFGSLSSHLTPLDVPGVDHPGLLGRLIRLAPATLPLALFAAVRAVRLALVDEWDDRAVVGGAFWVLWLAVAGLLPAFWPRGPYHLTGLFLLVPLNLLAARAICDLATRQAPVRALEWIAPATAVTVAWWSSENLSGAVDDLIHGRADSATALGLHLALDLVIAAVFLTRKLDRWARRRDDRQRRVLAVFLATVLVITVAAGSREVWFRHRETDDLLMLRTMILRRDREVPFTLVAVVGPEAYRQTADGLVPGGRLRFVLRSALPRLHQRDLATTDDLFALPQGQRLVILAGSDQRLPYSVQSKLGLEAIHPGRMGVLDAFATANAIGDSRSRKRE